MNYDDRLHMLSDLTIVRVDVTSSICSTTGFISNIVMHDISQ